MNTVVTWQTQSTSSNATEKLAEKIGHNLKGGEVIELVSDLGGGKTTFVRGLARGLGSEDHVSSPTFTVSKLYKAKDRTLHHFDFYRLPEPGIVQQELAEILNNREDIVVIEWAEIVKTVLPDKYIAIYIRATADTTREFTIECPEKFEYVIAGLK